MIAKREEMVSERDLQIYAAVRVDGRRQVDVAAEFSISQGRVSQVVRRVHRWRAGMGLEAELARRDRQAVDRWLEQLRIDKLYEETMELFRQSCQPRRKERRGKDHRGEWNSETIDHGPGNLQCLKLAGRLIALRREVDVEPPPPDQSANSPRSHLDEYEAFRLLVDMRNDAIQRGDVPQGEFSEDVVRRMIGKLVGRPIDAAPAKADVGQDSSCQATDQQDEQRQDKSCPTNTNTRAIITDISAGEEAERDEACAVTASPAASCDESLIQASTVGGANNREIFSGESEADRVGSASPTTPAGDEQGGHSSPYTPSHASLGRAWSCNSTEGESDSQIRDGQVDYCLAKFTATVSAS